MRHRIQTNQRALSFDANEQKLIKQLQTLAPNCLDEASKTAYNTANLLQKCQ